MAIKNKKRSYAFITSILETGGSLNQGSKPMEFVLEKTNRDHTLDGYKLVNGKLKPDKKSSVKGYLKNIDPSKIKELKQYGENLFSRLMNGGLIFKSGGSIRNMPCNKPKATPDHPTKSHVVKACENGKEKIIRFGQQGVKGSPYKPGESQKDKKRRLAFKARHAKNIAKGKMSAAYWSWREKW